MTQVLEQQIVDKTHAMRAIFQATKYKAKIQMKPHKRGFYIVSINTEVADDVWAATYDDEDATSIRHSPHDSPALNVRTPEYPFGHRVPCNVRMLKTTTPGVPLAKLLSHEDRPMPIFFAGHTYPVFTTSHGAVVAQAPNGGELGLEHDEYEVIDWLSVAA